MLKILFLTTAHQYDDDRILHHQAKELISQGHKVKICSLSSNYLGEIEGVEIESQAILNESATGKLEYLRKICARFNPDRIICSEPLAVIAAWLATRKSKAITVYDVTEWYPSTRMVATYPTLLKPFYALRFFLIQLFAGAVSDRYIFGEPSKKFPLSYIFPFKKKILLPYYPMKRYITEKIKNLNKNKELSVLTFRIIRADKQLRWMKFKIYPIVEDGNIVYVGRNDFQVKIRGMRIELGEIENAICSIDGISQSVVDVRKNNEGRQLICAFYTGAEVEAKNIRRKRTISLF